MMEVTCKKCGSNKTKIQHTAIDEFIPSDELYDGIEKFSKEQELENGNKLSNRIVTKEHLQCLCTVCKYMWATNTMDAR
jgi:hypothetical protein